MKVNQAQYPVRMMCRLLKISASGFYAWRDRPLSARASEDMDLTALIHSIHRRSKEAYGAPSIHAEIVDDDERRVGRKRVARLMRVANLRGATFKQFVRTTTSDASALPGENLVERHSEALEPDRLWVAVITYIPTWSGFLFLAVVLDAGSRRIVGCSMATHLKTELGLDALNLSLTQRQPQGVIHHSNHGWLPRSEWNNTPRRGGHERCQAFRKAGSTRSSGLQSRRL